MESINKVILWQDSEKLASELNAHRAVKADLSITVTAITAMGVEMSNELLLELCLGKSDLLHEKLTALLRVEVDRVELPHLKEATLKHLPAILTKANEIVYVLNKSFYNHGHLVYDCFFSWESKIILDEQPIIDKHTIYIDNEARATVKGMADIILEKIAELEEYLKNVTPDRRVKGFGSASSYRQPLLRVYTDGRDPEIDGKVFKHIHIT